MATPAIDSLGSRIFDHLRTMDAEACTVTPSGQCTGLSDYGRHARPDLQRPQAEVEWSKRLSQLLKPDVSSVACGKRYPEYAVLKSRGRQWCDLVITIAMGRLWLEVKGAWRDYWGGKSGIYRSYLFHPLVTGLPAKTHAVPFDLQRLSRLKPGDADYVGELLIGFERPDDPMDDDIRTLTQLAGLEGWSACSGSWPSAIVPNQQIRSWLWYKPTE